MSRDSNLGLTSILWRLALLFAELINRPFAHASLVMAHPILSCSIPGTWRVEHLKGNMQSRLGRLPDAAMRRRMVEYLKRL